MYVILWTPTLLSYRVVKTSPLDHLPQSLQLQVYKVMFEILFEGLNEEFYSDRHAKFKAISA
jgi:hypothetical protein